MKPQEKPVDLKISQLEFIIVPTQVSFRRTSAQAYFLELCKGPQIFRSFKEQIWVHPDEPAYCLANAQAAELKIHNERGACLQWVLYKVTEDDMKQYAVSIKSDISGCYSSYLQSLKEHAKDYHRLLNNQGQNVQLSKQWPELKQKLAYQMSIAAIEQERQITISFKVSIRCELDLAAEAQSKNRFEKQLCRTSSKGSYNLGSKTYIEDPGLHSEKAIEIRVNDKKAGTSESIFKKQGQDEVPRKKETLSDIVEASNECSSTMNHDQKNLRVQSAISQITEEQENSPTLHPATKTQNFERYNLGQLDQRKISTLKDDCNHLENQQDQMAEELPSMLKSKVKDPTESEIKEDPFANTETAVPSDIHPPQHQPKVQHGHKRNLLTVIALLVLLFLGAASFSALGFRSSALARSVLSQYFPFISKDENNKKRTTNQRENASGFAKKRGKKVEPAPADAEEKQEQRPKSIKKKEKEGRKEESRVNRKEDASRRKESKGKAKAESKVR